MDLGTVSRLLSGLPLPVLVVGAGQRVVAANPAIEALFGAPTEGRNVASVVRHPAFLAALDRTLSAQETTRARISVPSRGSGDLAMLVHVAPFADVSGAPGALVAFEDQTALERAELMRRDFVANVSHELRTPLTALVTSVEVLQRRRHELTERSRQALDLIDRDLHRFQRALEDLLELGRLESGAAGSVLTTVDLPDLVRHALESSGRQADLLTVNARAGDTQVTVDKARISRALVNLFENADRHGGGLTAVSVSASDGYVEVAVDDEGPGVPPADRDRIFDRFVRGGSRGSLPGTGLGLSLVAETVRAHDGHTWCGSGPHGPGARFVIRLPAASSPRDAP